MLICKQITYACPFESETIFLLVLQSITHLQDWKGIHLRIALSTFQHTLS